MGGELGTGKSQPHPVSSPFPPSPHVSRPCRGLQRCSGRAGAPHSAMGHPGHVPVSAVPRSGGSCHRAGPHWGPSPSPPPALHPQTRRDRATQSQLSVAMPMRLLNTPKDADPTNLCQHVVAHTVKKFPRAQMEPPVLQHPRRLCDPHWTLSRSLLCWGAQHWAQCPPGGLTSTEQRRRITSLGLLQHSSCCSPGHCLLCSPGRL